MKTRLPPGVWLFFGAATLVARAQESFDAFTDRAAADWVRARPQLATSTQYFSGAEQDALDRQLDASIARTGLPLDPAERVMRIARAQEILKRLAAYNRSELTPAQRTSAGVIESGLRSLVDVAPFADDWFSFDQFNGLHIQLVNFLSQTHPIRNRRDIENYLVRLGRVAPLIDLGVAQTKAQAEKGIILPKFLLTAVLGQLDRFLAPVPAKNVLVASLDERAAKLKDLSQEDRAAFVADAEKQVREAVLPAFGRVRELLAAQLPRATDDAGLWRLPQGAGAYAVALRANTTTTLSAAEIHAIGLAEVTRIEAEMDKRLRELGYTEGTVQERYTKLSDSLRPPAEPDPRPKLVAEYTQIVRDAERRSEALFDLRPKAPIDIRREPPFTEKNAAAHYSGPAPDGTRPGVFWIPLPEPRTDTIWTGAGMKSVSYHEAVPGHHFQIALQQEVPEIPRFRKFRVFGGSTAFTEGWALYAEQLAAESGWYDGDPQGRLGQLAAELFRARRLVVDTGLHADHWTRQQAIDYGIDVSEVERYVAMPGQACSYKLGQLEILRLRAKAKDALGAKFSLKEFHNVVLRTGDVPLTVLGNVIDDWILSAK